MSIRNEIDNLLKIQEIDIRIDLLEANIKNQPKKVEEKKLEIKNVENSILESKKKLEKIQKDRKMLELDTEENLNQIKKLQGRIYEVKTNKEYVALQDEIENLKKINSKKEENIITNMFEEDEVRKEINEKLAQKVQKEKELIEIENICMEEVKKSEEMLELEKQQRQILDENIDKKVLNQYEKIRKAKSGVAVAKIANNTCSECFMGIRPQIFIEISKDKELVFCESCFRILSFQLEPVAISK